MKENLTVRINSKPSAAESGRRQHGAAAYALLSAAATDVDSKKHKKNPFHERYVQLCLTEFGQVGKSYALLVTNSIIDLGSSLSHADKGAGCQGSTGELQQWCGG